MVMEPAVAVSTIFPEPVRFISASMVMEAVSTMKSISPEVPVIPCWELCWAPMVPSIPTRFVSTVTEVMVIASASERLDPPAPELELRLAMDVSSEFTLLPIPVPAVIRRPEPTISLFVSPASVMDPEAFNLMLPMLSPLEEILPTAMSAPASKLISPPLVEATAESDMVMSPSWARKSRVLLPAVDTLAFWLISVLASREICPVPPFSASFRLIEPVVVLSNTLPVPVAVKAVVSEPPSRVKEPALNTMFPLLPVKRSSWAAVSASPAVEASVPTRFTEMAAT